jgi:hypothetical protein
MWILRVLAGSLLWILAGVLGLVGVLLCVTLILIPLGIPVLMLARKVFALATTMFMPRKVRHPIDELGKSAKRGAKGAKGGVADAAHQTRKKSRSLVKQQRKRFA